MYCWGNFQSYSPLNLRFFDGKEHPGAQPDASMVMPACFLGQCFAMPCGPLLMQRVGARNTLLLGTYIMAAGVFGASYVTSLLPFCVLYGVIFGAGVGLAYTSPMIAGWAWMPKAKGLVSGAILTGFGAGGYLFNIVGSAIANPKKLNPVGGKFPAEVYASFPTLLRTLAAIYATLGTAGALLISEPPKPSTTAAKKAKPVEVPGVAVGTAVRSRQFWTMWLMIIASASAGLNVASMFKQFAATQPALAGDAYQVTVGAMGTLFNGVGRLFWGSLSDKIGFKASFTILTIVQAAVQLLYNQSGGSKPTFVVANCVAWFCLAGTFAMMPPAIQRMFGPKYGALIYGLVYSAFGVASVGSTFLSKALVASFGWEQVFKVLAAVSVLATVLTSTLTPLAALPSSTV